MHGLTTNRHEGCVSTMPTESGLSIALRVRRFKRSSERMRGARRQTPCDGVPFVLTTDRFGPKRLPKRHALLVLAADCADDRSRGLQRIGQYAEPPRSNDRQDGKEPYAAVGGMRTIDPFLPSSLTKTRRSTFQLTGGSRRNRSVSLDTSVAN